MESINKRVRRTRRDLDITQKELAEKSGVSFQAINRIERGKAKPQLETVAKLADALGVDLKWLIAGDGVPVPLHRQTATQQHREQGRSELAGKPGYVITDGGTWEVVDGEWRIVTDKDGETA